jgi:type IV pilus assembly protein PilB
MANLDIAERRLPQDGRLSVKFQNREIDLRVSSLPTIFGEKIVMRVLDKGSIVLDLARLGFEEDDLVRFKKTITTPYGMILVPGPTGSGKSTTLYAAIRDHQQPRHQYHHGRGSGRVQPARGQSGPRPRGHRL